MVADGCFKAVLYLSNVMLAKKVARGAWLMSGLVKLNDELITSEYLIKYLKVSGQFEEIMEKAKDYGSWFVAKQI